MRETVAREPLPEELNGIEPEHHGQPMIYKGGRFSWEGDFCIMIGRWICRSCDIRVEVHVKQYDPRGVDK